jgi:hypothetical protein
MSECVFLLSFILIEVMSCCFRTDTQSSVDEESASDGNTTSRKKRKEQEVNTETGNDDNEDEIEGSGDESETGADDRDSRNDGQNDEEDEEDEQGVNGDDEVVIYSGEDSDEMDDYDRNLIKMTELPKMKDKASTRVTRFSAKSPKKTDEALTRVTRYSTENQSIEEGEEEDDKEEDEENSQSLLAPITSPRKRLRPRNKGSGVESPQKTASQEVAAEKSNSASDQDHDADGEEEALSPRKLRKREGEQNGAKEVSAFSPSKDKNPILKKSQRSEAAQVSPCKTKSEAYVNLGKRTNITSPKQSKSDSVAPACRERSIECTLTPQTSEQVSDEEIHKDSGPSPANAKKKGSSLQCPRKVVTPQKQDADGRFRTEASTPPPMDGHRESESRIRTRAHGKENTAQLNGHRRARVRGDEDDEPVPSTSAESPPNRKRREALAKVSGGVCVCVHACGCVGFLCPVRNMMTLFSYSLTFLSSIMIGVCYE